MTTKLVNADGRNIFHGATTVILTLGDFFVKQSFLVVENLLTLVMLACDYLTTNGYILNCKQETFHRAENPIQLIAAESLSWYLNTMNDDSPIAIPTKCKDYRSTVEKMLCHVHLNLIPCSSRRIQRTPFTLAR